VLNDAEIVWRLLAVKESGALWPDEVVEVREVLLKVYQLPAELVDPADRGMTERTGKTRQSTPGGWSRTGGYGLARPPIRPSGGPDGPAANGASLVMTAPQRAAWGQGGSRMDPIRPL
jgi:hypothetical protein